MVTQVLSSTTSQLTVLGLAFLEQNLFTTYSFNPATLQHDDRENPPTCAFQISLVSLLETLQIFGVADVKDKWSYRDPAYSSITSSLSRGGPDAAFSKDVLGMTGVCRLRHAGLGEPLCIILEEAGVTTTCELVTYEPELQTEIPLRRDALAQKIIMRASWLHDAIAELSSTSPTRLTIVASPVPPYFSLSATGPLGSATVEFTKDAQLLETFQVQKRVVNTYKFSMIKAAARAMAMALKVSIRGDENGVLSLQFMIEVEGGGMSFVDFRIVPFIDEGSEEEEEDVVDGEFHDDGPDDDPDDGRAE